VDDLEAERKSWSGGCQCGAVRYHFEGAPLKASICHCRMCQKAFGSWGAALISLPAAGFEWTRGKPAEFRSSATVARGFCAGCGTPLYMRDDGDANYEIAIGALDDPNAIPPMDGQVGVESEVRWFSAMHKLPRQRTEDYCSPEDLKRYASLQHPDRDTEEWPPR
jgi:hypothetical protein